MARKPDCSRNGLTLWPEWPVLVAGKSDCGRNGLLLYLLRARKADFCTVTCFLLVDRVSRCKGVSKFGPQTSLSPRIPETPNLPLYIVQGPRDS